MFPTLILCNYPVNHSEMTANVPTFEYEAPFTPTRPKKKRKNRIPQERPDSAIALSSTVQELASGGWVYECMRTSHRISESLTLGLTFPRHRLELLREALQVLALQRPRVLCFGLGSPSSSRDARAQLAFLLAACDDLTLVCTSLLYVLYTRNTARSCVPRSDRQPPYMILFSRKKMNDF